MIDDEKTKVNSEPTAEAAIQVGQVSSSGTTQTMPVIDVGQVFLHADPNKQEVSRHLTWTAIKHAWLNFDI
ncbi:MAG TPA: hypothetical protein VN843_15600 [Anaerolineales bacterium]|nr:hypothetical protein [Anaerolineales bacterium]